MTFTHQKQTALHLPSKETNKLMLLPAFIWVGMLLYLSTGKNVSPPKLTSLLEPDKLAHAVAYFVLSSLLCFGLSRAFRFDSPKQIIGWSVFVSGGIGIALEFVQLFFFPDRSFEFFDIIANIIGSVSCVLLSNFLIK